MAKIVVLEDDYTLLDLYRDVLERAKHSVYPASTLQAVQEYFDRNAADAVIADLRLDATTAEETVHALKHIQKKHNIPVVLISAQMMIYEEMCRKAGFEYLLTKPFPNSVLIQITEKVIDKS